MTSKELKDREESDESLFWLELMVDANLVTKPRAERLLKEADELTAIFTTSVKTAKSQSTPLGS